MLTQRDFGDRTDRKHARIKYTMEDYGVTWFRAQVEERWGQQFEPARDYKFTRKGDRIGWHQQTDETWSVGIHIPAGRVKGQVRQGVRRACEALQRTQAIVRMTCNQGMYLQNIPNVMKPQISKILDKYEVPHLEAYVSGMRRNMMACVATPTCPLAMADAETYLPTLVGKIEDLLEKNGLSQEAISIRMTGCPNSCGRPELAEIGFIGRAPGYYNMYLGADREGHRMNTLYKEQVNEADILDLLQPLLAGYAKKGVPGEGFGDYCVRTGAVKAMTAGRLWWDLGNFS
jgi:sulfite reductase (NADPH) hemoprotein beta-component